MLDPEVLTWLFSVTGIPAGLTDLLEVRKIVEPAAARMAALRATPEDLIEIREAYMGMESAVGDLPSSVESDLRFHLAVLEATHNAFMRPFGALIQTALRASFRLTSSNRTLYRKTLTLHRAVVDAIEAGEDDRAEATMLAVLAQTSRDIATQTKVAMGGKENVGSHKALRTGVNRMPEEKRTFRSAAWFGRDDKDGFIHRGWMRNQGLPSHVFDGRPVIGICNTWSELTPCNAHLRTLADQVKRGVWEAGGLPLEFPVMSTGETNLRPTAMLFRNLVSMDVEESIRGNPIDGVVLMCGCDKTTPSLVMGAASCDIPAIVVSGGPMLNGKFHGRDIGSGTDVWRFSEGVKAGTMTQIEFNEAESCMSRSAGHCMTMGTASTMASMVEALGLSMPHNAAIPAVDSRRGVLAHMSGRRIVEMVHEGLCISKILKKEAFENAIRVNGAVGGSTNAVIHLLAIAGRVGVPLTLDDWDRIGRNTPTLVDLMPSGRFLMEDFYYAGGLPAVIRALDSKNLLHSSALTVTGKSIGENCKDAPNWNEEVIRPLHNPLVEHGGVAVLRGNLAPDGAVLKPSAASPHLMRHRGRAVVFRTIEHYKERIVDPDLDVDENSVLVLQNCGPKGYPGMAEVGNMGLPPKLLARGVKDMVRVSDARMSGTAYGTVVLHVCPEAATGGPLALVKDGDVIELDVDARRLHLDVSDEELSRRRADWTATPSPVTGGYQQMYVQHVMQASEGADLDFLVGCRGTTVTRESH